MFIIAWLVMQVLLANQVVIPEIVSTIISVLAVLETLLYAVVIAIQIWAFKKIRKPFKK